jgi:predicted  nucleic acid-binding Zn-ribbon protein
MIGDRDALIARKQEVRRRIERLQQQLEPMRNAGATVDARQIAKLESELERLQADEYSLRLAIDQMSARR